MIIIKVIIIMELLARMQIELNALHIMRSSIMLHFNMNFAKKWWRFSKADSLGQLPEAVVRRCSVKIVLLKFHKIYGKSSMLQSPFNKTPAKVFFRCSFVKPFRVSRKLQEYHFCITLPGNCFCISRAGGFSLFQERFLIMYFFKQYSLIKHF